MSETANRRCDPPTTCRKRNHSGCSKPGGPNRRVFHESLEEDGALGHHSQQRQLEGPAFGVNGVATMVKTNQVDAGIVFKPVAIAFGLREVQTLPHNLTGDIVFGACTLRGRNEKWSKKFTDFARDHVKGIR